MNSITNLEFMETSFEKRREEFDKLQKLPINKSLLSRIISVLSEAFIYFNTSYRADVFLNVEHMSRGKLAGGDSSRGTQKIIHLLKQMQKEKAAPTPDLDNLIKALEYANSINKTPFLRFLLAGKIKKDIKNLKVGESLAIPSDTREHAMLLDITCTGKENEHSRYKVVQFNEGAGSENHPSFFIGGKEKVQGGLEIKDVPGEKLYGTESSFIKKILMSKSLFLGNSVEELYKEKGILSSLGKIEGSNDKRLWSRGQLGGSCTTRSPLALVRSQMSAEDYATFRDIAKTEMLFERYRKIKKGTGNSTINKVITLELIDNLCHTYESKSRDTPSELVAMKNELTKMLSAELSSEQWESKIKNQAHQSKGATRLNGLRIDLENPSLVDNVNMAFFVLNEGKLSKDSMKFAIPLIKKALRSKDELTEEEAIKLLNISSLIVNNLNSEILTKEQIYVLTALSLVLKNQFTRINNNEGFRAKIEKKVDFKKRKAQVDQFSNSKIHMSMSLNLGSRFKDKTFRRRLVKMKRVVGIPRV